jgi:methionyl-tRNA synthetase
LLSRIASPKLLERVGELINTTSVHEEDAAVEEMLRSAREAFEGRMEKFEIQRALEGVMDLVMEVGSSFFD